MGGGFGFIDLVKIYLNMVIEFKKIIGNGENSIGKFCCWWNNGFNIK